MVKNLAANGGDVRCQEDPLEEGMATHSSILAWRIPVDRGAWWATVDGATKSQTQLRDFHFHFQKEIIQMNLFTKQKQT